MYMPIQVGGENYLNTKETTDMLGISRAKLNVLVREGKLKQYQQAVRDVPIYREADIKKLLEIQER